MLQEHNTQVCLPKLITLQLLLTLMDTCSDFTLSNSHCKIESMNIIQSCLRIHPNLSFWMTPEAILYDIHTFNFTVQ